MQLYVKIGTGPGSWAYVRRLRKPPKVGAVIHIRRIPSIHRERWQEVRVTDIWDLGNDLKLYIVTL